MNAQELLDDLRERHVEVSAAGDSLRLVAPRGVLTEELRRILSDRKPELLKLLGGSGAAGVQPDSGQADAERIAAMPLDEFARAGLIVQVKSSVLGCRVLFVSDDVPEDALAGEVLPVYRAAELRKLALLRSGPRAVRRVHEVKTILNGRITDVRKKQDQGR